MNYDDNKLRAYTHMATCNKTMRGTVGIPFSVWKVLAEKTAGVHSRTRLPNTHPTLIGGGSMGHRDCYLLPSEDNCWEITVCDDLRHGRLVTVHCYHPNAFDVMLSTLERDRGYFKSVLTHEPTQNTLRELQERFANHVINEIFG